MHFLLTGQTTLTRRVPARNHPDMPDAPADACDPAVPGPIAARPGDLVPLREAARQVDRSISTLREWIRDGELAGWKPEGATAANAPTLVSLAEVRLRMVVGEKAIVPGRPPGLLRERPGEQGGGAAEVSGEGREAALLREQAREHALRLEIVDAKAALRIAEVEREALRAEVERLREQQGQSVRLLEAAQQDLRGAWERERARADGAEAEVRVLRAGLQLPWWRRLLTG